MTLAGLAFASPWALLGLAFLLVLLWRRRRSGLLRALALAALVLALAQPWLSVPGGQLALVVDVSDSVGSRALEIARQLDLSASTADLEVVLAAADSVRASSLASPPPNTLNTSATDLARSLQVAVANGASRVLLVSDGVTPEMQLLAGLPSVPIDVVVVPGVTDVRMQELLLPAQAAPGQPVEGVAVIRANRAEQLTLRVQVAGSDLPAMIVDVKPGENAVPFSFNVGEGPRTLVSVTLLTSYDQPTGNDHASGEVAVLARAPMLVIDDPALARLLELQGIDVVTGTPADLTAPLNYGAVALRGSSADFSSGQLALLRSFVEGGGGLLMTGGPESFGFGSWYRTPVEEVLPVTTDLRTEVSLPLVAMVLIIDRSGSMASGRPTRIELAKEGALQVVQLAYQTDLLGLIAFSDGPGTYWVFELRPASERGKREMAQGILALTTGGGTILGPAYDQALTALRQAEAAVKHVIILSDGQLYDGQGPFGGAPIDFGSVASEALADGISTSTIAIGAEADFTRLQAIAAGGGGRYYAAMDAGTLPQIFTSEALTATRALLVDEPTVPRGRANPLYPFPAQLPTVDAYIATTLRSDAQALLLGRNDEPLLATRRAGLGRTAALTTDLNNWSGALGAWPELPGAIATVARWLQARPPGWSASAERSGNEVQLVIDAVEDGEYVNNARIEGRFGGKSVLLEQVAPGRYQGRVPWSASAGSEVVFAASGEVVARAQVSGPDPEYADVDGAALLASVALRTGGNVINPELPYDPPMTAGRRQLWPYFTLAALALFLLELVWRRRLG